MKGVAADTRKQALTMGFLTGAMTIPFLEWVHQLSDCISRFAVL
jgi:hypothetical protein